MYKPQNHQEKVLHRLKIAQGHLKKVIQMVEEGAYCIDVIHQSQAVGSGLKEVDNLLMENHLKCCAQDAIKHGRGEEAINEIMNVFKKTKL